MSPLLLLAAETPDERAATLLVSLLGLALVGSSLLLTAAFLVLLFGPWEPTEGPPPNVR